MGIVQTICKLSAGKVRKLYQLAKDRSGVSAIEMGIGAPILVSCAIIATDLGTGMVQQIELTGAARAGAQYASIRKPVQLDFTEIEQAALDALTSTTGGNELQGVVVSTTLSCECSGGTAIQCTQTCGGGEFRQAYMNITITKDWNPIVPYPGISWPINLSGESTMRLQ